MGKAGKKVLFVHYRTGERDGVSLEIEKRAQIMEELGAEVHFLSGYDGLSRKNAKIIPLIDLRASYNTFLRENAFYKRLFDETTMLFLFHKLENKFAIRIGKYLDKLQPDAIFVHNVFSHAYNLPFTTALLKVLDQFQFPTIAVNHDFWFEREIFRHPKYRFVDTILRSLPPNRPYIKHLTINTRATAEMWTRRKIKATTTGDYFDFETPTPVLSEEEKTKILSSLGIDPNALIVLHATRITERKAIELAIATVASLKKELKRLSTAFDYNGKRITRKTEPVLLFPNFVEIDAVKYWHTIRAYAAKLGVTAIFAGDNFAIKEKEANGLDVFNFWDSYGVADLVTYTSVAEGFGNQFLEAIYFRKLPLVFEYPVFEEDIKEEGYKYVSLGNKTRLYQGLHTISEQVKNQAARQALGLLRDSKALKMLTSHNHQLATRLHSTRSLRSNLTELYRTI